MKLLTKVNLILVCLFGIAGLVICEVAYRFLIENARREVMKEAELMMASAQSVRDYTAQNLRPLLEQNPLHKTKFIAETVPAVGAINTFNRLRQKYPDYSYREATLNPTNPEDRASDWEADVIGYFRNHPGLKTFSGDRETPAGPAIFLASPLQATAECMECHSRPAAAPPAMTATYGSERGFGWKQGSVIAAQIVSVPTSLPIGIAKRGFRVLLTYLIVVLILTILALDAGIYFIVIRPLRLVSEAADRASKGQVGSDPLPVKGNDEIATMTASFNRMQVSLAKALKLLG
jgi:HAMP domain-containing protein